MKVMNDRETILELLDINQEFIEIFQHYGLQPPAPLVEKLARITKTFRETIEANEQGITESPPKEA